MGLLSDITYWIVLAQAEAGGAGDGGAGDGGAAGQPPAAGDGGMWSNIITFAPFILIAVLFYFLMIRPQQQKQAEQSEMLSNLKKNDRIVTIGGIIGTVVNLQKDSKEVTIKVDENSNAKIRILRESIARVTSDEDDKEKQDEATT